MTPLTEFVNSLKRGTVHDVAISEFSPHGVGVGLVDGRRVGVPQTIPGDLVRIRMMTGHHGIKTGKVIEMLTPSLIRTASICSHYPDCGGCQLIDVQYDQQLAMKFKVFSSIFEESLHPVIKPIIASPSSQFYRNKMEFSFGLSNSGHVILGLKRRGQFDQVVPITTCFLQSHRSNEVLIVVQAYFQTHPISVWNYHQFKGILRYLTIRESKSTQEMVVTFVVSEPCPELLMPLAQQLIADIPQVTSVLMAVHEGVSDTAFTSTYMPLVGSSLLTETLGHLRFQLSPLSFFQVNPAQAKTLYDCVRDAANLSGSERVLDLYCGTGTIGLYLADLAKDVIGIEENIQAVEDAYFNRTLNGIKNADFICGNVRQILKDTAFGADVIIVDPPRSGIAPKAMTRILEIGAPRLVYVSCNPVSFSENLSVIFEAGYQLTSLQPVDMFPNTLHVECVGTFEK